MAHIIDGGMSEEELQELRARKEVDIELAFRNKTSACVTAFENAVLDEPAMGRACRKVALDDMTRGVESAAIEYQAAMNTFEQKV